MVMRDGHVNHVNPPNSPCTHKLWGFLVPTSSRCMDLTTSPSLNMRCEISRHNRAVPANMDLLETGKW